MATLMVGISPRFNGYAGVAGYTYVVGNKINEAQRTCFNDSGVRLIASQNQI